MHAFEILIPLDGTPTPLQVVYAGPEDSDARLASIGLADLIEAYNRRVPPSRLLFICPSGVEEQIKQSFDDKRREFDGRLASASHVAIAPYDENGRLILAGVLELKASERWDIDDSLLERLGNHAIARIFDDTKTVLHAPHGYAFRKLSDREEDVFVRAGNMLRDPGSLAVFGHMLLRRLPTACGLIYIDSFTILSFAMGLQSLIDHFRRSGAALPALAIQNFHSYEVSREFRIPNEPNYLVLISASTSGGLSHKLVREKQADPSRIVHLLGVGPPGSHFRHSCIYFRERDQPPRPRSPAGQRNALIEIATEEFLVAQGPPKPVAITREHVNPDGARELHKPFYRDALKFHQPAYGVGYSTFSVSPDPADAECSPMRAWVSERLVHELPASVCMLVHIGDPMSARLVEWLREALPRHVDVISLSELDDSTLGSASSHGSVAVVAHQDPGLERLRETNVALRRLDPVHRHYVVGYAFPASRSEHARLKADLRTQPSGPRYGWSEYLVLPIGADALHESLAPQGATLSDQAIESRRPVFGDVLAEALIGRNTQPSIPGDGLFLPRTDGKSVALRQGSIFFPDTPDANVSQITVHAMVSAALQKARETDRWTAQGRPPTHPGFDDNPFVRSVLDPSMFARYSDGVLQASLLRSTQRSELDYSASDDLSRQFASACGSVLSSHGHAVGDAALEFVYALATRKVFLRSAEQERLRRQVDAIPVLAAFWELLEPDEDQLPMPPGTP